MEIASLIVGIICMILLIVLIFRKGGTGGDEGFSSEELEALAEQLDTLRKEHREGQSELRRELNTMLNDAMRTLNDQTQSNQRHWAGEQLPSKLQSLTDEAYRSYSARETDNFFEVIMVNDNIVFFIGNKNS